MIQFETAKECISFIEKIKRFKDKMSLDKIRLASKLLGNPHLQFRSIHVAGTNGKGSTVNMLKHILMDAGYQVGTYISPYITIFNERITLNNDYITDQEIVYYTNKIMPIYETFLTEYDDNLTFFEIVTLMSFLYFANHPVDFVIYEVGLGGLLDATNIIEPELTIITSIGFDHMNVLGNTLEEIAIQKLGIVKPRIPLVSGVGEEPLQSLFYKYVKQYDTSVTFVNYDLLTDVSLTSNHTIFSYKNYKHLECNLIGYHQANNAALAIESIELLNKKSNLGITEANIRNGLIHVYWPGRMEVVSEEPLVILDGAHNIHGISALVETLQAFREKYVIKCVFSCLSDKETLKMISKLEEVVDEIYFSSFDYHRAQASTDMLVLSNIKNKYSSDDYKTLIQDVIKQSSTNHLIIITGSLYFISNVRKLFK